MPLPDDVSSSMASARISKRPVSQCRDVIKSRTVMAVRLDGPLSSDHVQQLTNICGQLVVELNGLQATFLGLVGRPQLLSKWKPLQAGKDWGTPILVHLELVEDSGVRSGDVSPKMGFKECKYESLVSSSAMTAWRPLRSVLAGSAALAEPAWFH